MSGHLYRGKPMPVTEEMIDLLMAEIDRLNKRIMELHQQKRDMLRRVRTR